jgi:hypothetical protein
MTEEWTLIETSLVQDMKLICETIIKNNLNVEVNTLPPTTLWQLTKKVYRELEELDEEEEEEE